MKYLWSKTVHSRQVALTILVLLCIWEISVRALGVREFMLPAPSKIIVEFFQSPGYLLMQSLSTLETTVVGFVLAVVLGVVIAIGIVSFQFLDRTLYSLLVALNAVPKVALAPLFRSEEHTSELQSIMRISYAVFCLQKKTK